MKNKVFYYLMALIMVLTPSPTIIAIIVDKKEPNGKEVNKPVEIIIPRPYYNEFDKDRIGKRGLSKKSYSKSAVIDSYNSSNGKARALSKSYIR